MILFYYKTYANALEIVLDQKIIQYLIGPIRKFIHRRISRLLTYWTIIDIYCYAYVLWLLLCWIVTRGYYCATIPQIYH